MIPLWHKLSVLVQYASVMERVDISCRSAKSDNKTYAVECAKHRRDRWCLAIMMGSIPYPKQKSGEQMKAGSKYGITLCGTDRENG